VTRGDPRTCPPSASASLGRPRISARLLPTHCCRLTAAQLLSTGLSGSLLPEDSAATRGLNYYWTVATGGLSCYCRASDSLARSSADGSAHTISSYLSATTGRSMESSRAGEPATLFRMCVWEVSARACAVSASG